MSIEQTLGVLLLTISIWRLQPPNGLWKKATVESEPKAGSGYGRMNANWFARFWEKWARSIRHIAPYQTPILPLLHIAIGFLFVFPEYY